MLPVTINDEHWTIITRLEVQVREESAQFRQLAIITSGGWWCSLRIEAHSWNVLQRERSIHQRYPTVSEVGPFRKKQTWAHNLSTSSSGDLCFIDTLVTLDQQQGDCGSRHEGLITARGWPRTSGMIQRWFPTLELCLVWRAHKQQAWQWKPTPQNATTVTTYNKQHQQTPTTTHHPTHPPTHPDLSVCWFTLQIQSPGLSCMPSQRPAPGKPRLKHRRWESEGCKTLEFLDDILRIS